jgi:hypothetical protein
VILLEANILHFLLPIFTFMFYLSSTINCLTVESFLKNSLLDPELMIPHETWHGPHRTPGHGKKYLAEESAQTHSVAAITLGAQTHSVAAITLGCPRSSPRFPSFPGQLVLRPAHPPAAAARTPPGPRLPVRPAAARAPHYRRLRADLRSGRQHALLPPARPAVARTPHGRPRAPRPPPARPAADAAHTPRCRLRAQAAARSAADRASLGRPHAPRPPARPVAARMPRPAAALAPRGRHPRAPQRTPPTRPVAACAPCSRPHAPRPPVRPLAVRPLAVRTPRGRSPCADATRMPRGRPFPPWPTLRFAAAFAPHGFDRLPPARRRRTRFDCLPCIQTMTGLRLPPLLETSPRGAAACCAPTGSLQAAWRGSRVGGERFHVYNHGGERFHVYNHGGERFHVYNPCVQPREAAAGRDQT